VIDPPVFIPWNAVYDRRSDEQAFLVEREGAEHWQPFWGLRYNLASGRDVFAGHNVPTAGDVPRSEEVNDPCRTTDRTTTF
jgi:hypothetical protein